MPDPLSAPILSTPPASALPAAPGPSRRTRKVASGYALVVVAVLGFASGLPLALTGQADRKSVV